MRGESKRHTETIGRYGSERKAQAYAASSSLASRWSDVWVEREAAVYVVKGRLNPLRRAA